MVAALEGANLPGDIREHLVLLVNNHARSLSHRDRVIAGIAVHPGDGPHATGIASHIADNFARYVEHGSCWDLRCLDAAMELDDAGASIPTSARQVARIRAGNRSG